MSFQRSKPSPSGLIADNTGDSRTFDDGKKNLELALASFQSTLNDGERMKLQQMKGGPCDAESIIQFTHELDSLDTGRRGKSMATTSHSLLQSVEQFYHIADTYVSSHPEIAALVWGSVKLAFMVLGNFTSYFQKFSELLRGFDQFVPRFAEYQRLFSDSNRLRCATYEFQTAIIRCCSQMIIATRRPWQNQLLAALSQSFQTEMRPFVDDIRSKAKEVKQEVELAKVQAHHQEQILQSQERRQAGESRREFSRWFARSDKEMQALRQEELVRAREQKWNTLVERLSHYDYAAAFKSARGKRHNGTAEWIFHTAEFESWYRSDISVVLHLMGKIGSGKTVLTANVIDYLFRSRQQNLQAIAFFFVRFDDPPSQQSECIVRSIIRQLFNHGSDDPVLLQFLEASCDQFFDNDSLMTLLSERVRSFKDFFLVLDGFDECTLADRKVMLKSISMISEACKLTTRVKILLSSRSSVRQEIDHMDLTIIRITLGAEKIGKDLERYAEEMLSEKVSTKELIVQDENLLENILQVVSMGGEGMFLWVSLTIEDICSRTSDLEIQESLENIPRKLPETFDRALQRIVNNGKADIAQAIFNWTATVRRPLTLDQLKESLSVSVGQKHSAPERYPSKLGQLASWCENLLHVEETDETVRFCHHSVRKYLLRHSKTFRIHQRDWDHHVGEICLTYLDFTDFKKALAKTSAPKSVDVANYPAGITTETVRKLLPTVKKEKIISSVQKWVQISDRHAFIHEPQTNARASKPVLGYPFFQYASDQWIFHTTGFRARTTETWDLWKTMISTELTSWVDSNWEPNDCVPSNEYWLPTGQHTIPELVREHFVSWHKAVLLAEFTEHYTLMDQIFSVLQQHRANLSTKLLRTLMSAKQIVVGLYSPLPLTLTDSDIHGTIIHIFTRYIAAGGWLADESTESEKCNLEPTEKHLDGIFQDVCTLLCERRWVSGQSMLVRRLLSQLAVTELSVDLHEIITLALTGSHTNEIQEARTIQSRTIVNIVIERDQAWWLAVADSLPRELKLSPSYSIMMRESLKYALRAQDEASALLLLQERHIDWTDEGTMDHELTHFAIQFKNMNRGLRQQLIDTIIGSRSSEQIAISIKQKARTKIMDSCGYYDENGIENLSGIGGERWEFDEEERRYTGSILHAIDRSYWDFAVALYKHGLGPTTTERREKGSFEATNDILSCINLQGDIREVLGGTCYLTEDGSEGLQVVYCKSHSGLAGLISEVRRLFTTSRAELLAEESADT